MLLFQAPENSSKIATSVLLCQIFKLLKQKKEKTVKKVTDLCLLEIVINDHITECHWQHNEKIIV